MSVLGAIKNKFLKNKPFAGSSICICMYPNEELAARSLKLP